jgi:hypothetical protein
MLAGAKVPNSLLPFLLCFMLFSIYACEPKDIYEGVYKVEGETPPKNTETQLELKERGIGVWRVFDEEVSFRWDIKDSEIWLSTKLGGIIIGKIRGEIIEITLPGSKAMSFRKVFKSRSETPLRSIRQA